MISKIKMSPLQRTQYGKMIRKAREDKKLVKGAVASKLGQPIYILERIERGEVVVLHSNVYKRLEEILGITSCPLTCSQQQLPHPTYDSMDTSNEVV